MAEGGGRIKADPLFLALTRPTMILGVTYSWFGFNAGFWAVYFINTNSFTHIIVGGVTVHMIGFLLSANEPRFMEIMMIGVKVRSKCSNRFYHRDTSSYDLY